MLPNLIVIGAMKSGTTTLHNYLEQHPEFFGSFPKEPMFFASAKAKKLGQAWYESFFAGHRAQAVLFEASTTYTQRSSSKEVARRIHETIPGVKLVYLVRCPVDRMVSHHRHQVVYGAKMNLSEALEGSDEYLETSSYHSRLAPYLKLFPRKHIQVHAFEDFCNDPRKVLREICQLMRVTEAPVDDIDVSEKKNSSAENLRRAAKRLNYDPRPYIETGPGVSPKRRQEILSCLTEEKDQLERALGQRFSHWDLEGSFDRVFEK